MNSRLKYDAVVIGVSFGGPQALATILPALPADFMMPVVVVQHLGSHSENYWIRSLEKRCNIPVAEAEEKEPLQPGHIYVAPANYHLMIESDRSFSLSTDSRVNFARPSIDVLFESAARVYKNKLIGIILTGANSDGANGLKHIKDAGGLALVQDPATAESATMPLAAIQLAKVDHILPLAGITKILTQLGKYETID